MVVWLRHILTTNKLYLRCTRSSKGALWEENFALVAVVNARNAAGWCSKAGCVFPRQALVIHVSSGLSVVMGNNWCWLGRRVLHHRYSIISLNMDVVFMHLSLLRETPPRAKSGLGGDLTREYYYWPHI